MSKACHAFPFQYATVYVQRRFLSVIENTVQLQVGVGIDILTLVRFDSALPSTAVVPLSMKL